jgi:hypothetical protein
MLKYMQNYKLNGDNQKNIKEIEKILVESSVNEAGVLCCITAITW